jgi:hypothetical protein
MGVACTRRLGRGGCNRHAPVGGVPAPSASCVYQKAQNPSALTASGALNPIISGKNVARPS